MDESANKSINWFIKQKKELEVKENITTESLFVNIFYLLPFSFVCLLNKI